MLVRAQVQPRSETGHAMRCDVTQRSGLHPLGGSPVPAQYLSMSSLSSTPVNTPLYDGSPPPMNLVGMCTMGLRLSVFRRLCNVPYPPALPA
ncbi:hypothetical protein TgHK011_006441 [Trichoderma gracile]|nr:hypothetical protein TgHK011_006441 [Trichoderma gracile]